MYLDLIDNRRINPGYLVNDTSAVNMTSGLLTVVFLLYILDTGLASFLKYSTIAKTIFKRHSLLYTSFAEVKQVYHDDCCFKKAIAKVEHFTKAARQYFLFKI